MNVRYVLPAAFFLGLIGLEVGHGLFRLQTLRQDQRRRLVELVEHEHRGLARDLHDLLGEGKRHAEFLARLPELREVVAAGPDSAPARSVTGLVLRYLQSFAGIDRVCLLDDSGAELLRCERMGGGVGSLPPSLLARRSADPILDLAAGRPPGTVVVSPPSVDRERVEVSEADRSVYHYVTRLGEAGGTLIVSVYASALSQPVAAFAPLPGVSAVLVDAAGRTVLPRDPGDPETTAVAEVLVEQPAAVAALREGTGRTEVGDAVLLIEPVSDEPDLKVVTVVPAEAAASLGSWAESRGRIITSMVLVGVTIAAASIFFVRQGMRAVRLRETERRLGQVERERRRYRSLMEAAADSLLIVDPGAGAVREWNRQARDLLPLPGGPGEGPAVDLSDLLGEDTAAILGEAMTEALAAPGTVASRENLWLSGRDERRLLMDARLTAVELDGEHLVEIALRTAPTVITWNCRCRPANACGPSVSSPPG